MLKSCRRVTLKGFHCEWIMYRWRSELTSEGGGSLQGKLLHANLGVWGAWPPGNLEALSS